MKNPADGEPDPNDHEQTLICDQPTTLYVTTRMSDAPNNATSVVRSFLWETPPDPDVAAGIQQMMEAIVTAGDGNQRSLRRGRVGATSAA